MRSTKKIFHPTNPRSRNQMPRSTKAHELTLTTLLVALLFAVTPSHAQTRPDKDYLVYVLSEGADTISLIRFGPGGARVDHEVATGDMPIDIDGPHGIAISPNREFYYVSLAHGRPFGSVWKYSTRDDQVLGPAPLRFFPAPMDLSSPRSLLSRF